MGVTWTVEGKVSNEGAGPRVDLIHAACEEANLTQEGESRPKDSG